MNEEKIKEIFEKIKHNFQGTLEKEFFLNNTEKIDYISKKDDMIVGIEVKGSRSNLYNCIGQLFFFKKIFSHLYILAPLNFINKLTEIIKETFLYKEIGLLTITSNELVVIKEPNVDKYYFQPFKNQPLKKKKLQETQAKTINNMEIIKKFQGKIFTVIDFIQEFNLSRENAYRKLSHLKKLKIIEEINPGSNPKMFKINT